MKKDIKISTAYKVVKKGIEPGVYHSASLQNSTFRATYGIGQITYPTVPHSHLFVFNTLNNAKMFLGDNQYNNYSIFECEVTNPIAAKWRIYNYENTDNLLNGWLQRYKGKDGKVELVDAPAGTLFVDSVKLLRNVS